MKKLFWTQIYADYQDYKKRIYLRKSASEMICATFPIQGGEEK